MTDQFLQPFNHVNIDCNGTIHMSIILLFGSSHAFSSLFLANIYAVRSFYCCSQVQKSQLILKGCLYGIPVPAKVYRSEHTHLPAPAHTHQTKCDKCLLWLLLESFNTLESSFPHCISGADMVARLCLGMRPLAV